MRLPTKVLHGLAVAVAGIGLAGCDCGMRAPTNAQQPTLPSTDPTVNPGNAPVEQPGQVCEPGACPACGRG